MSDFGIKYINPVGCVYHFPPITDVMAYYHCLAKISPRMEIEIYHYSGTYHFSIELRLYSKKSKVLRTCAINQVYVEKDSDPAEIMARIKGIANACANDGEHLAGIDFEEEKDHD